LREIVTREMGGPSSENPALMTELGTLYLHMGDVKRGKFWLERALLRDRTYRPAHEQLLALYEKGTTEEDRERAAFHRRALGGYKH
jgi:Tfp pilus assembly protein PilF